MKIIIIIKLYTAHKFGRRTELFCVCIMFDFTFGTNTKHKVAVVQNMMKIAMRTNKASL